MRTCVRISGQFRQAINGRNIALADRAARLEPLTLDQALEYVILLAEKCDDRYERAAARFVARLAVEKRLSLAQHGRAVALMDTLPTDPDGARAALLPLCRRS